MSHRLDRYLTESMEGLKKMEATTVKEKVTAAIERMETRTMDHYDNISALSIHWKSDDTGGDKDSELFLETISTLGNVDARNRVLGDEEKVAVLNLEVISQASSIKGRRTLFILHYAGHAIASSPTNTLVITSRIAKKEFEGPQMSMTYIKNGLQHLVEDTEGLDVLIVLDCCCAAIAAGRGISVAGKRLELMAATSAGGLSNSRQDRPGRTFTEHWCTAFKYYLKTEKPFDCGDIRGLINAAFDLEQFPATYVIREGWGIPIVFRALPAAVTKKPPAIRAVITALHVEEEYDSETFAALVSYLERAPVKVSVVAVLPVASTLLLLQVPQILQELLELPQVALIFLPCDQED